MVFMNLARLVMPENKAPMLFQHSYGQSIIIWSRVFGCCLTRLIIVGGWIYISTTIHNNNHFLLPGSASPPEEVINQLAEQYRFRSTYSYDY